MKKTITASLAALALAGAVFASSAPAEARWRHRGHWGAPVAAGVVGALALGAIAASAYQPVYGYPATCIEDRPVFNRRGDIIRWRRVHVAC